MKPRVLVIGVTIAAFIAVLVGLYFKGRQDAARKLEPVAVQSDINKAATEVVDRYSTQVHEVRIRTDEAIREVREAPGADDPIAPAVLDAWRRGLRNTEATDPTAEQP